MKHLLMSLFSLLLFFLPGCSKKAPQSIIQPQQALIAIDEVPTTLETGVLISKKCAVPKARTNDAYARDLLQLTLGLRDTARGKIHKIPALANGSLFNLGGVTTLLSLTTTSIQQEDCATTVLEGRYEQNKAHFSIISHTIEQGEKQPLTTLSFTPVQPDATFCSQFLDETFDTFEYGYASNEISLTLTQGLHTTGLRTAKLCRQGSDMSMTVTLEPKEITYQLKGYGLEPHQFLTTIIGIPSAPSPQLKKAITMKKNVLFVLMPREFQDSEFLGTHTALTKAGCTIDIAGLSSGICVGKAGTEVTPTKLLSSMMLTDFDAYDAIVITGGYGSPTFLWNNEELQAVVRYFHEQKKLVATICYASIVPAQAGILQNRMATVYPTDIAKEIFADNQVIFSNDLCIDLEKEHIITAQSPQAVEPFVAALLKYLAPPLTLKDVLHG